METFPCKKFKIGDYIFADLHSAREPYWICKIEEIQKQSTDIQIKVKLFFRRRHITKELLVIADKYTDSFLHNEEFDWDAAENPAYNPDYVKLHYKLLQRNLFVSKEYVIISPDMIKGRCYVFLLTMADSPMDVLTNENKFFFLLAYDVSNQEVHEDKGSIMIGNNYQAELPGCSKNRPHEPDRDALIWAPAKCSDKTYTQLNSISKSVQALKNLTKPNPKARSLQSYRDTHLFSAMEILHRGNYDIKSAASTIVKDKAVSYNTLDSWTGDEVLIFERALDKYGKQFNYIRVEFLPWKSWESIISFYYYWKGTSSYKAWKQRYYHDQGDLKELEVVMREWDLPALTGNETSVSKCPGCGKVFKLPDSFWYSWGPVSEPLMICKGCAVYWKRFAGFPDSPELEEKYWESTSPPSVGLPHSRLFKCDSEGCGKAFKSKSGLQRHKVLSHSNQSRDHLFLCTEEAMAARKCLGNKAIRRIARRPCHTSRVR